MTARRRSLLLPSKGSIPSCSAKAAAAVLSQQCWQCSCGYYVCSDVGSFHLMASRATNVHVHVHQYISSPKNLSTVRVVLASTGPLSALEDLSRRLYTAGLDNSTYRDCKQACVYVYYDKAQKLTKTKQHKSQGNYFNKK